MPLNRRFSGYCKYSWLFLWLGLGANALGAVPAKMPGFGSPSSQSATNLPGVDIANNPVLLQKELQQKLADTRNEIGFAGLDSPVQEAFPRGLFLQMIAHAIEIQLNSLDDLQRQRQNLAAWEQSVKNQSNGMMLSLSPFLEAEQLRDALMLADKQLVRLEQMQTLVEQEGQRRIKTAEQSAAKLRQVTEALENSQGLNKAKLNEERAELALRHRLDWVRMVATQVEIQRIQQQAKDMRSKRDFAMTRKSQLNSLTQMTESDLQTVRRNIQLERQALLAEIQTAMTRFDAANADAASKSNPTAELNLQGLESKLEFLQLRQMIWEARWAYTGITDLEKVRQAYEQIKYWQHDSQVLREYLELKLLATLHRLSENRNQLETNTLVQEPQSAAMEQLQILSRVIGSLDATESLLLRCRQDLEKHFQIQTRTERWHERWVSLQSLLSDIWQYELFVAEDVIEVDGQPIKGQRSITVDKVFSALLILVIGYWLALWLARLIEKQAVDRFGIDPCLARIARRWILFVEVVLLATISLMIVHIPLTVFAFMGGAVAIGAGFGMQNLLKNLISGLMLMLERPFRPGDLVEVGGVRGRITDIGVRSSHIRDANGIETLIPNSVFIEEQVTNWTLTSQSVRIVVKVGVAYGSPVQQVTDSLLEAAARHGLIQDKPAPQVLFEDFGSDALLFGLYVWVELTPEVDWRLVASDLRYIINKKFAAEKITIAFPQRDVRLEVTQPLAVKLSNDF